VENQTENELIFFENCQIIPIEKIDAFSAQSETLSA
jgi:hypothetical protein